MKIKYRNIINKAIVPALTLCAGLSFMQGVSAYSGTQTQEAQYESQNTPSPKGISSLLPSKNPYNELTISKIAMQKLWDPYYLTQAMVKKFHKGIKSSMEKSIAKRSSHEGTAPRPYPLPLESQQSPLPH